MSTYEYYSSVSLVYDRLRNPVGADVFAAFIVSQHADCDKSKIRVLDAGCGTGNYCQRLITKHGLTNITAFDANKDMLACAKSKISKLMATEENTVQFIEGKLPALPFDQGSFDAIMFNFVLHHLELPNLKHGFATSKAAITNAVECLADGGILAIGTITAEQMRNAQWFCVLLPEELYADICYRVMPVDMIVEHLEQLGLKDIKVLVTRNESIFTKEALENYNAPLEAEWRNSISTFSQMSDVQVKQMTEKIEGMKADGTFENFIKERKKLGDICGQTTLIIAKK